MKRFGSSRRSSGTETHLLPCDGSQSFDASIEHLLHDWRLDRLVQLYVFLEALPVAIGTATSTILSYDLVKRESLATIDDVSILVFPFVSFYIVINVCHNITYNSLHGDKLFVIDVLSFHDNVLTLNCYFMNCCCSCYSIISW